MGTLSKRRSQRRHSATAALAATQVLCHCKPPPHRGAGGQVQQACPVVGLAGPAACPPKMPNRWHDVAIRRVRAQGLSKQLRTAASCSCFTHTFCESYMRIPGALAGYAARVRPKSALGGGWKPFHPAIARLAGPRAQPARRQHRRMCREGAQALSWRGPCAATAMMPLQRET